MYPLTEIPCPKCQQKRLFVGNDSKVRCFNTDCDFESDFPDFFLKSHNSPEDRSYFRTKIPEVFSLPDIGKSPKTIPKDIGSKFILSNMNLSNMKMNWSFSEMWGLPLGSAEPDEGERKALYYLSFAISLAIFASFLAITGVYMDIAWHTIGFGIMCWVFIASRAVDILTTIFVIGKGAIETNPLSDPHDISRLLKAHGFQILLVIGIGYALCCWNIWIGKGLMLSISLLGFRAGLSNVTQMLHKLLLPTSVEEVKRLFYINAFICSVIICAAAYFVIPYFIH